METLRIVKHAEKDKNRIILPKFIIEKFGRDFYLEINVKNGSMKLKPIKENKKGE